MKKPRRRKPQFKKAKAPDRQHDSPVWALYLGMPGILVIAITAIYIHFF